MLGAFRSAHAGPRSAAARVGLAALLACIGLTWTAGASSAFATYGTVSITKKNVGGDAADLFHFDAPSAIKAGGFDLKGGETYTNSHVVYNTSRYAQAYTVSEPASDKYTLKSIDCDVTPAYHNGSAVTSLATRSVAIKVGVGEKVACTFTNERKTGTITVKKQLEPATDTGKFDLKVDGTQVASQVGDGGYGSATVPTGTHTVDEYGANLGDYVRYTKCVKGATVVAEGSGAVSVPVGYGDQIVCTVKNVRKAKIVVVKHTAPADTAATKTAFDFSLNPGAIAYSLTDGGSDTRTVEPGKAYTVTEADARAKGYKLTAIDCTSGTSDVATRSATVTPAAGETVTCTYTNTKLVTAIDIEKSGPATATAGDLLTYTLDVTNPGEMPFAAADVAVTDAKCNAAPALQSTNGDATPAVLDPGDRWTYTCRVQTAAGQTSVINVADVTGTDENHNVVTDEDTFTTTLTQPPSTPQPPVTPRTPAQAVAPAQQVAGVTATSPARRGTAALRGPRACPRTSTVSATVTGRQIRRVTFLVGGKKVKTMTKADRNGRFVLKLRTSSLRRGANAVVARVEFTAASGTRTRSLRITITRCAAQAVQPKFTG
jgi:prealbumin domain-containing protein